ncbi:hypothetical protein OS42_23550 [Dickeya oryzae]
MLSDGVRPLGQGHKKNRHGDVAVGGLRFVVLSGLELFPVVVIASARQRGFQGRFKRSRFFLTPV